MRGSEDFYLKAKAISWLLRQLLSGHEPVVEGLDAEGGVRALLLRKKEKGTA